MYTCFKLNNPQGLNKIIFNNSGSYLCTGNVDVRVVVMYYTYSYMIRLKKINSLTELINILG